MSLIKSRKGKTFYDRNFLLLCHLILQFKTPGDFHSKILRGERSVQFMSGSNYRVTVTSFGASSFTAFTASSSVEYTFTMIDLSPASI